MTNNFRLIKVPFLRKMTPSCLVHDGMLPLRIGISRKVSTQKNSRSGGVFLDCPFEEKDEARERALGGIK